MNYGFGRVMRSAPAGKIFAHFFFTGKWRFSVNCLLKTSAVFIRFISLSIYVKQTRHNPSVRFIVEIIYYCWGAVCLLLQHFLCLYLTEKGAWSFYLMRVRGWEREMKSKQNDLTSSGASNPSVGRHVQSWCWNAFSSIIGFIAWIAIPHILSSSVLVYLWGLGFW